MTGLKTIKGMELSHLITTDLNWNSRTWQICTPDSRVTEVSEAEIKNGCRIYRIQLVQESKYFNSFRLILPP